MDRNMKVHIAEFQLNATQHYITKISRLGEIPTVDPVSGDFRPQDVFCLFEKVAKKK